MSAFDRRLPQPWRRAAEVWPWVLVATSWAALLAARAAGYSRVFDHDALVGTGRLPPLASILAFGVAWEVMTVATMLPGSTAIVDLFRHANRANQGSRWVSLAFLGGYLLVWTAFAVLALSGDSLVHRLANSWPWLAGRPWLIEGTTLIVAGGFQFTSLKERCLAQCRSPLAFFVRHYRRGWAGAFRLGAQHGRFCLGCCWALMLLMFALGVGSMAWMLNLAAVSFVERTTAPGGRFVRVFGVVLVACGLLVLFHFEWPAQLVGIVSP